MKYQTEQHEKVSNNPLTCFSRFFVLLLCRGLKGAADGNAEAAGKGGSKVLSKRESKKSKQQAIDTGVIDAK